MKTLKLGDSVPEVMVLEAKLAKRGYSPMLDALGAGNVQGIFDEQDAEHVRLFQESHHGPDGEPLKVDRIVGPATWWALDNDSRILPSVTIPPSPSGEGGVPHFDQRDKMGVFLSFIPIQMVAVRLPYYADKSGADHTFWLNAEVAESFIAGIDKWKVKFGGLYIVTETYRTIASQAAARARKPSLCLRAGWSLHGHGRAVDGHIRPENQKLLIRLYKHMQRFGWWTVFNRPGEPVKFQSSESWHVQNTLDADLKTASGLRSKIYLTRWAKAHGGEGALRKIVKKEVRS